MKKTLTVSLAASLLTLATTLQVIAKPTNQELKIGISQEFENLNPLIMSMAASTYMSALVNRGFVVLTPDLKWEPQLAKEIPSQKNGLMKLVDRPDGKKGMVVNWEIRENAAWETGLR